MSAYVWERLILKVILLEIMHVHNLKGQIVVLYYATLIYKIKTFNGNIFLVF